VIIFTTLGNVFTLNNLSSSAQAVARGVIIILAVLLQQRLATGGLNVRRRRGGAGTSGQAVLQGSPAGSVSGGTSEPGGPGGTRPGAPPT
jgi:ribose transport system permease protein